MPRIAMLEGLSDSPAAVAPAPSGPVAVAQSAVTNVQVTLMQLTSTLRDVNSGLNIGPINDAIANLDQKRAAVANGQMTAQAWLKSADTLIKAVSGQAAQQPPMSDLDIAIKAVMDSIAQAKARVGGGVMPWLLGGAVLLGAWYFWPSGGSSGGFSGRITLRTDRRAPRR